MNATEELLRTAMAALVVAAGGTLKIRPRDLAKMPDGGLSFRLEGDDLELIYDRSRKREHIAAPVIAGAEIANTALIELGLAVVAINAGGSVKLTVADLDRLVRSDGALTFTVEGDGGINFTFFNGGG